MNTFGRLFRVSLFGESHGSCVGVVVDGCPSGVTFSIDEMMVDIARRRGGVKGTTRREERDVPEVLSGVYNGYTTGSPITLLTRNDDVDSSGYEAYKTIPRPGHVDFVAGKKYKGFADGRGGGHFSGRLTWGVVAAGVLAKKIIKDISVDAKVVSVGGRDDVDDAVKEAEERGDSVGGIVECLVRNAPVGLGEPFFYSIESAISSLLFSIPGIKGVEFGDGFRAATMNGSRFNDPIVDESGKTSSNHSGGINGGLSNGNDIVFRVAVRPASSIGIEQRTFNMSTKNMESLIVTGRHDACIALRMPVIVEAAASIALADLMLCSMR